MTHPCSTTLLRRALPPYESPPDEPSPVLDASLDDARHACGGALALGGTTDAAYHYCEHCGAYTYDLDAPLPSGVDVHANVSAWTQRRRSSPEAL